MRFPSVNWTPVICWIEANTSKHCALFCSVLTLTILIPLGDIAVSFGTGTRCLPGVMYYMTQWHAWAIYSVIICTRFNLWCWHCYITTLVSINLHKGRLTLNFIVWIVVVMRLYATNMSFEHTLWINCVIISQAQSRASTLPDIHHHSTVG